nr:exodeoxyribonuclease VII large subunit [Lysobacter sp. CAU 1642]
MTPSQLNALARSLLEDSFGLVEVEGELSNLARPASGHLYFSLKDRNAQVRCALFRPKSQWLRFKPADGDRVLARGKLSLYEPRGDYQLIVEHLEPAGEGALRAAFEALKAKLQAEGLFSTERKRPIPDRVARLGVLTSPSGAAVHDVLSVLRRRFPLVEVELLPVPVQGTEAPGQIARMVARADASGRYDVLLLTRGGGSLEDLAAFNDEGLARAIAACRTPTVSAVGHEIDVSIADFVADLRCPTPSAAAEALVPDRSVLAQRLQRAEQRLQAAGARLMRERAQQLDRLALRLEAQRPLRRLQRHGELLARTGERLHSVIELHLGQRRQRLAQLAGRLRGSHPGRALAANRQRLESLRRALQGSVAAQARTRALQLAQLGRTLEAVSPLQTLQRGYSVLRKDGKPVRAASQVQPGDRLEAQLAEGKLDLRSL